MSVCVLQNLEKYRVLWTDCLASCREINRFSVSKIRPKPAKPTISLALISVMTGANGDAISFRSLGEIWPRPLVLSGFWQRSSFITPFT